MTDQIANTCSSCVKKDLVCDQTTCQDYLAAPTETTTMHLDNTKRSCFVKCRRKFYYQYVLNLKTFFGSTALRYGLTWHAGMEIFYGFIKENGWKDLAEPLRLATEAMKAEWDLASEKETFYSDYRTLENAFKSILLYIDHYALDRNHLQITATEMPFKIHMEIENDEEYKHFKGLIPFHFTGKIDLEVLLNGRKWIIEHKTTGQSLDVQTNRLHRSAQVMGYTYAKIRESGSRKEAPEGALISIHHLSATKSRAKGKEGEYGTPRIDFRRPPQIFTDNDIMQWRNSFLSIALDIQREMERNLWPMNHDACFDYGSCPFLEMCEQNPSVENLYINDQKYYIGEAWEVAKDVAAEGVIY